jgi:AAA family ATP:ADP antiporter
MGDWSTRLFNFSRKELPLAALAALFYFSVLCGYFLLRPVREAMGVSRGMDELRWLFVVTSIASLVVVIAFGGVVARLDRRSFIPIGYLFVIACLALFATLLILDVSSGGGIIGSGSESPLARGISYTYYVWLSVINLFINSLFWAYMVDIFTTDQSKRMFAFIGVGGTLGSIVAGTATKFIAESTTSAYLPAGLMLMGAAFFGIAIAVMLTLDRVARREASLRSDSLSSSREESGKPIGGGFWDGATAIARSPYLLGIGGYIAFIAISNTMIYFTQATIVLENTDTFSERLRGFAQFDMLAETATLLTQVFLTTRIIKRLGVGWTLAILPLITVAGFAVLAFWPTYGVIAIFQAFHRAGRHAVSRPARESLFSVLSASEKYKAKPVVDVFVYRLGDVAGAGMDAALRAMGASIGWLAAATVPLASIWVVLSVALGRAQAQKTQQREAAADNAARQAKAQEA